MKVFAFAFASLLFAFMSLDIYSQDDAIGPAMIMEGRYLGESAPLRDMPTLTAAEWDAMVEKAEKKALNPKLRLREFPYAETALPKGVDPVWQKHMGAGQGSRAPIINFQGQQSPYYPPDANGTAGPNHYMQTINTVYAIYNKSGSLVAGPAALNTLFSGVSGSTCNDGDPIVLYDEQADRWLVAEFSFCLANDYMLVAVSTTNDPTGTWHKYSFDVADMPDYPKFGVWQDGYYLATNNSLSTDTYVLERSQMLVGGTAQMVGFDNPWRPNTVDGFMCVPPVDNDGSFAPANSPGIFITISDDAIAGGSDQLWILELDVDWTSPGSSTLSRTQQIDVAAFDSNFGTTWNNIAQQGTSQKLDAIPQVIMNAPQYRNFGSYETILCCHTVDVDLTDHAGIRWYELRRAGGNWVIRQQGTYAPDDHSRWMGSIMLNGSGEIGLGYSISSSYMYPGIRYCGQSAAAYGAATGILDVAEEIIQSGSSSQTAANRWGDYSAMQVDPADDETFWFTSQYPGASGARLTKIASFQIPDVPLTADFTADKTHVATYSVVQFTDQSLGGPVSWTWNISPATVTYVNSTSSTSRSPRVQFDAPGFYTVSLTVDDGVNNDTETRIDYIQVSDCNFPPPFSQDMSDGNLPPCWSIIDHQGNGQIWQFNNPGARAVNTTTAGNGFAILDSDHYGTGNSQNADLVSPIFDFFNYTNIVLTFEHWFQAYSGSSATLSYSVDGGLTWSLIQSWTNTTANAETFNQDLTAMVGGKQQVMFKWNYTGSYGYYWAVDDISITGTAQGIWTGANSSDWNTLSNWINNTLPGSTINVTIPENSPHWPLSSGDLVLGTSCQDLVMEGASELTVGGSLVIPYGASLSLTGAGLVRVGGDWTSPGTFSAGTGTVEFNGAGPASVSGPEYTNIAIDDYLRALFDKSMSLLTGASAGPTGDNGYADAPIGFTFYYAGAAYSQIRISTNGWASLNLTGTSEVLNGRLFTTSVPNATLAPWFDNLEADASSAIQYKTEGIAPQRVFTIEWKNVLTFNHQATARISFQAKLHETNHIIEFHYGDLVGGTFSNSESASIGIEDAAGGVGHFIDGTTGSMTTGVQDLLSESDWPSQNIRFTPPPVIQEFHHVVIGNTGGNVNFNSDTRVTGAFSILPGGDFSVTNGKTLELKNDF